MSHMTMGDEIHALRCDRASLLRELEELQAERDAAVEQVVYWRELEKVKAELEALDAQLERVKDIIHRDNSATRFSEIVAVMAEKPATSLARLKAEWQAKALESVAGRYGHNEEYPQYCMHCILEVEAAELRRQADIMV